MVVPRKWVNIMRFLQIIWDDDYNPEGNVQHIAEHGLTTSDVEWVIENPTTEDTNRSSKRRAVLGIRPVATTSL